ncbi:uncharacterized protein DAT39_019902, partial [Clarias magur]
MVLLRPAMSSSVEGVPTEADGTPSTDKFPNTERSLTDIMTLLYIYIFCVAACVVSIRAAPLTYCAEVGSTVVLPCEWRDLSITTPHVKWFIGSEFLFERQGKVSIPGKGYEGRVDVPEDELLKGNCSLVLKDVRLTDEGVYSSYMLVNDGKTPAVAHKVQLSVYDKPETPSDRKSDSS